jgi:endonuclease/exonuclease/phosphatase family metal-dependent hydrolase
MNDPATAARIEARLVREHDGLFRRGSSWSNIFAGEAEEPHLCASTAGLDMLLKALDPTRLLGLLLWHGWSVARVAGNLVAETVLAFRDFLRGTIAGRDFLAELRFVPTRVVVTAVMREIITAGAAIDCERGLPIIHLNYLGYDEHGHRRGPDSRFALWTLRGIDRSIRRVWLAAHRSPRRDYQVWIFSDHGQEATRPYPLVHGEDVRTAVARVHTAWRTPPVVADARGRQGPALVTDTEVSRTPPVDADAAGSPDQPAARSGRDRAGREARRRLAARAGTAERRAWLAEDLPEWLARGLPAVPGEGPRAERRRRRTSGDPPLPSPPRRPAQLEVVHQGPVGFVYLPESAEGAHLADLARRVAREAHIPTVLFRAEPGRAAGFCADGTFVRLPGDLARIVGAHHPFAAEVQDDLLRVVHHPDAGDLTLLGYDPRGPFSLQLENGAHGGPGPRETRAFALLPREAGALPERLRLANLHDLARAALAGRARPSTGRSAALGARPFRVATYNVHSCRGMDGVYSPARIARVLLREQPDIICLQELEHGIGRSGWALQVSEIAESLSSEYHFHGITRVDDGDFGNAILSRHPMERIRSGELPNWAGKRRGVLWVVVTLGGRRVHVLNTHLSVVERERRLQADALLGPEWLGSRELVGSIVLCGDLNASRRAYTCRRLGERLRNVEAAGLASEAANTWSSRVPLRRIDHAFVSSDLEVRETWVPRTRLTRVASDHLPLLVDLEFRPDPG